jgi:hypothetical protein
LKTLIIHAGNNSGKQFHAFVSSICKTTTKILLHFLAGAVCRSKQAHWCRKQTKDGHDNDASWSGCHPTAFGKHLLVFSHESVFLLLLLGTGVNHPKWEERL